MTQSEYAAGADQWIVVYDVEDTGSEIIPATIFAQVAADVAKQAQAGRRIVSIAPVSTRHAGAYFSREGSGYETKISIVVAYSAARP